MSMSSTQHARPLNADALRAWPLPSLSDDADKEVRGQVLVIAGSREIPGAAVLAATAALRAGAGKLVIATAASVAQQMAFSMPEARVVALPETPQGGFDISGVAMLEACLAAARATVIGPGLMDEEATCRFVEAVLPQLAGRPVVLDAMAMDVLAQRERFDDPVLLTPHAGEMAHLTGASKDAIQADPQAAVQNAARRWNAVVALKGASTLIAAPQGDTWLHDGGNAGLATSGSGDTLAGAIAGLAARGATLEQACAWGVVLHAQAGNKLAGRMGAIGYLARELPAEIMKAMNELQA